MIVNYVDNTRNNRVIAEISSSGQYIIRIRAQMKLTYIKTLKKLLLYVA